MAYQIAVDWLDRRAKLSPKKTALIDANTGAQTSYVDWNIRAIRTANFLKENYGVRQGDVVAILSKNNAEYLDLIFACNKLGAILQCLNWRSTIAEISRAIEHTEPKVLIYSNDFVDLTKTLDASHCKSYMQFVALDKKAHKSHAKFSSRNKFSKQPTPMPIMAESSLWMICYTGGSTGISKGVSLSYEMVMANAVNTVISLELNKDDLTTLNAPLFHASGLNVFTLPFVFVGATSVLCHGYDVDELYRVVKKHPLTVFYGVPSVFNGMRRHALWQKTDFSKFRLMIAGGAICPKPVMQAFLQRNINFVVGYGLSEAGPNTFMLPADQLHTKAGAAGYALHGIQTRIVDENHKLIETPGVVGELWIRGAHRTGGYFKNLIATTTAIDADGWLHTQDLASFDEDGAYTIHGRQNEMFKAGEKAIFPAEVEDALYSHPSVLEACVFGLPETSFGGLGGALVSTSGIDAAAKQALKKYLQDALIEIDIPLTIEIVDSLPKTASGKFDQKEIKRSRESQAVAEGE